MSEALRKLVNLGIGSAFMFRRVTVGFERALCLGAACAISLTIPCPAGEPGPPVSPCAFDHTHEEYVVNAKAMVDAGADLGEMLDTLACIGRTKKQTGYWVDPQSAAFGAWFALAPSDEVRRRRLLAIVEDPETTYGFFMQATELLLYVADEHARNVLLAQFQQSWPVDQFAPSNPRWRACLTFFLEDDDPRITPLIEKFIAYHEPSHPMRGHFESYLRDLRMGNSKEDLLGEIESCRKGGARPWAIRRALRLTDDAEEVRAAVRRWMAEEVQINGSFLTIADVFAFTEQLRLFDENEEGLVAKCREFLRISERMGCRAGPESTVPWADEIIRTKRAAYYGTTSK